MNAVHTPMTVKFLHLRRHELGYQRIGHGCDTTLTSFCRLSPTGGVTVAYRDLGDGDVQIGVGRCRTGERYNRQLGRDAAMQNLLRSPGTCVLHAEAGRTIERIIDHVDSLYERNLREQLVSKFVPQGKGLQPQIGQVATLHLVQSEPENETGYKSPLTGG